MSTFFKKVSPWYLIPFLFFCLLTLFNVSGIIALAPNISSVKAIGCGGNVGDCISYGIWIVLSVPSFLFFLISIMFRKIRDFKPLMIIVFVFMLLNIAIGLIGNWAMPDK